MALKILLADDSMTAQNMGKKILVDAGYEVIPVSNGAAAVKKIAEHRPDLAILDIYMPGYTGLEVCDRVKNAPETSRMPVLLTVGKMEPYRADDGAKVKADGVIIKPFEASDLIAAVSKLEQLIVPKVAAPAKVEEFPEDEQWRTDAASGSVTNEPANDFNVPDVMSSSPAMLAELSVEAPPEQPMSMAAAAIPVFTEVPEFESGPSNDYSTDAESPAFDAIEASVPPAFGPFDTQVIESLGNSAPAYMDMYSVAEPEELDVPAAPKVIEATAAQPAAPAELHVEETPAHFELELNEAAPEAPIVVEAPPDLEFNSAPKAGDVEVRQVEDLMPADTPQTVAVPEEIQDPCLITDPAEVVNPYIGAAASRTSEENPSIVPFAEVAEPEVAASVPQASVAEVEAPVELHAEETVVLPSEASLLLEEEMQHSMEQPEPTESAPLVEALVEPGIVEGGQEPVVVPPAPVEAAAEVEPVVAEEVSAFLISEHQEPVVEAEADHDQAKSLSAIDQLRAEIKAMEAMAMEPAVSSSSDAVEDALEESTPVETPVPAAEVEPEAAAVPAEVAISEVAAAEDEPADDILGYDPEKEVTATETQPEAHFEPLPEAEAQIAPASEVQLEAPDPEPQAAPEPEADFEPTPAPVPEPQPDNHHEALAMAAAAVTSGIAPAVGDSLIADVVQRVFDRHKSQMIEEIARELAEGANK